MSNFMQFEVTKAAIYGIKHSGKSLNNATSLENSIKVHRQKFILGYNQIQSFKKLCWLTFDTCFKIFVPGSQADIFQKESNRYGNVEERAIPPNAGNKYICTHI